MGKHNESVLCNPRTPPHDPYYSPAPAPTRYKATTSLIPLYDTTTSDDPARSKPNTQSPGSTHTADNADAMANDKTDNNMAIYTTAIKSTHADQ